MRIIVIDDHSLVRMGVEMLASLENDIQLVGSASNEKEALKLIEEVRPDVALVDLRMQGEYGLDIIKKARSMNMACKFIILTSFATEQEIRSALNEGVDGYILKEAMPSELIFAIRLVSKGRKYYDPVVIQYAMEQDREDVNRLTPRETEVLSSLARGLSNKAIAEELVISEHTVKKHIVQILDKLNLHDRTQAALYAVSKGLNK